MQPQGTPARPAERWRGGRAGQIFPAVGGALWGACLNLGYPWSPHVTYLFICTLQVGPSGYVACDKRKLYRVGPNCETWPNTLTENSY